MFGAKSPLTVDENMVMAAIAAAEGWEPGTLWTARGIVWRTDDDGSLRSICALGTPFWQEAFAAETSARLIARVRV